VCGIVGFFRPLYLKPGLPPRRGVIEAQQFIPPLAGYGDGKQGAGAIFLQNDAEIFTKPSHIAGVNYEKFL
jgi:hypothetical protein